MSQELKEAYEMQTISLEEYSKRIAEEAAMIEGMEKGKFEVARKMLARKMPVSEIVDITGLNERDVLSL
jgi:ribosome-binding protein aMBF1 (putative translation factor)